MNQLEEDVHSRILDGVKKYSRIVAQARQRGMNERDTADIVRVILGDMLGFDPFFDVTTEISIRGPNADYAVLAEGRLQFLMIVKPLGVTPHSAHLLRLSGSSAPTFAEWAILTNADIWACYRLGVGPDRHAELVFRVSLLEPKETRSQEEKADLFSSICKEAIQQHALLSYWLQRRVLHPGRIASMLLSEEMLNLLRRDLMRATNYRVDRQTLYHLLIRDVLRPETLVGGNGEEAVPTQPQCYAYVRNPHDASTWRLRYRNPDGTPHAELLTLAVAELSGDVRSLGIPADDVPLVKERLRQAYLDLGVVREDLPEILRL
jgi:hypothetical protein